MKISGLILLLFISIFSFSQTSKKITTTKTVTTVRKKTTVKKPIAKTYSLPANTQVWIVDAQRGKCEGSLETRMCLLVKKPGDKDFNLFYSDIAGFDYKEGYVYILWVKTEPKSPPIPSNNSVSNYTLVKIVSKKEIKGYNIPSNEIKKPLSGMNEMMTKTFVVNEGRVPCEGNPNSKCLLIKQPNKTTFEIFYQNIEGFTFEPGYRQTITVSERHIANPMEKQTAPIYTLMEVVKKEWIGGSIKKDTMTIPQSNNPLDKKWILRKMKDTDTSSFLIDDNVVYMEINAAENRLTGKAPCNTFVGGLKSNLMSSFYASAIVNTKLYCNNMKMEDLFFTLLQNAERFEIKDGKLSLYKGDRLLLVFE